MFGIKSVVYESNNITFCININEKTFFNGNISEKINEEIIFNYLERLFCIIDTWQEEYSKLNIISQDSWKLLINYNNGKVKKYSGHSAFPNNFEAFERLNHDLIKGII